MEPGSSRPRQLEVGKPWVARPSAADRVLSRLEVWGQRLGLERIRELLHLLDEPQLRLPSVLVAGTNGKGSTTALLAAIGRAAGYRTGLYNSPHLESVEERIRLDGRAITSSQLSELLREIIDLSERRMSTLPTYFETLTASAILHFARNQVELGVFEVGLGGRLDATNVTEPALSVITSIGFDHQEHLGDTLAAIAGEKAGIARAERPLLVSCPDQPDVLAAFERCAAEVGTTVVDGHLQVASTAQMTDQGLDVELRTPVRQYRLKTALHGEHQVQNLALAVRAAEMLAELGWQRIDEQAIATGVERCRWPGRLEWVDLRGVAATGPASVERVLLDGAHNPSGGRALCQYLDHTGARPDLLFGSLHKKHVAPILEDLAERCERIILTTPHSERARSPAELQAMLDPGRAEVVDDCGQALELALGGNESSSSTLLVCGSLYLVGEVRQRLRHRFAVPSATVDLTVG